MYWDFNLANAYTKMNAVAAYTHNSPHRKEKTNRGDGRGCRRDVVSSPPHCRADFLRAGGVARRIET